jgi:hypothetical protein
MDGGVKGQLLIRVCENEEKERERKEEGEGRV